MANITTVEKLAKGITPASSENAVIKSTNSVYKRSGSAPLDVTEIFFDKLSADAYANGTLKSTFQFGSKSYVGQHITVIDKDNSSAAMYQIQNEAGDLKKLLAEPLKGIEFDFDKKTLKEVLKDLIEALGGVAKESQE